MNKETLEDWWCNLTIAQKERIASKYVSKHAGVTMTCYYPNCTNLWNSLSDFDKQVIYEHCTDAHGLLLTEYKEGKMFSE